MCQINPDCACCDRSWPEPCDTYEKGMNGRCVYCDHEGKCHKSWSDIFLAARRRGESIDSAANIAELRMMKRNLRKRHGA
jgi:hypothetical protein